MKCDICGGTNTYIKNYKHEYTIKGKNIEDHIKFIEELNSKVIEKLEKAMEYHKIPMEQTRPKTIKGIEKQLGLWEYEETYIRFKTLGAKRYMYEYVDKKTGQIKHKITVAGVNKMKGIEYLEKRFGELLFENFAEGLYIPASWKDETGEITNPSGKNTHTYIDDEKAGLVTDYLGETTSFYEKSSVHLQRTSYELSFSKDFINYLKGIKNYVNI